MRDKTKFFLLRLSPLINMQVQMDVSGHPGVWARAARPGRTWLKCSCPGSGAPSSGAAPRRSNRRPSCAADRLRLAPNTLSTSSLKASPGPSASPPRPAAASSRSPATARPGAILAGVTPHDRNGLERTGACRAQPRRCPRAPVRRRRRSGSAVARGAPGPPAPSK